MNLQSVSKWKLIRITWMLLFDDYKKDYSVIGKYATFYKEPTRWELMGLVLRRDSDKIALWQHVYPNSTDPLVLFSIYLNNEFIIEYLLDDAQLDFDPLYN